MNPWVPAWQEQAACKNKAALFFPKQSASYRTDDLRLEPAKKLCKGCPVFVDCRADAESSPFTWGFWAGQLWRDGAVCA